MRIDFHTHIFPDTLAPRALAALIAGAKAQGKSCPPCTDGTADGLRRLMQSCRVDKSVSLPIVTKLSQTPSVNRFAAERQSAEICCFGGVHPLDPDCENILEQLAQSGFRGVKVHPEFQQFTADSPKALAFFRKAEALGLLVCIHAGEDIGFPPPYHCTPRMLRHVLEYVHGDNIVAAHLGGFGMWDDVERELVGTPIRMDTAFVGGFIEPAQYKRIIKSHGADKILFGSDAPWQSPAEAYRHLSALGLPEDDLDKILWRNAAVLLNLSTDDPSECVRPNYS